MFISNEKHTHKSVNLVKLAMPEGIGPVRPLPCMTLHYDEKADVYIHQGINR